MQHPTSHTSLTVLCFVSLFSYNAIHSAAEEYKKVSPLAIVAFAGAALEKHKHTAQQDIDRILKGAHKPDTGTVIQHKDFNFGGGKKVRSIGIVDQHKGLHIAISADRVDKLDHKDMNKVYDHLKILEGSRRNKLVTLIGYDEGGEFVSTLAKRKSNHYRNVKVFTIEAEKVEQRSNQEHWCDEYSIVPKSYSVSPYVKLPTKKSHWSLVSNHEMHRFLALLKDKDWQFIEKCKQESLSK